MRVREPVCRAPGCAEVVSCCVRLCAGHRRASCSDLDLDPATRCESVGFPAEILGDETALVPLRGGGCTLVDAADLPVLAGRRWWREQRPNVCYARCSEGCRRRGLYLHRILMGEPPEPGMSVDHINGDGLDNRRKNLRWATAEEQAANRDRLRELGW